MITAPDRIVHSALDYAGRGWPVFPCQPGSKEPATRHGFHDASTDLDQIRRWWDWQPDANVAIATGSPGPDVLDVDQHGPAGNGFADCRRLAGAGLLGGALAVVATQRGGLHIYFTGTIQPCGRLARQHLDFRGVGGYVIAPPSRIGGRPYRLLRHRPNAGSLDWAAVIELLEPARDRSARPAAGPHADAGRLVAWVERLAVGNRNCGLFWAACRAAEAGQMSLLNDLAAAAARTGLPEPEISRTIASARRTARAPHTHRHPTGP